MEDAWKIMKLYKIEKNEIVTKTYEKQSWEEKTPACDAQKKKGGSEAHRRGAGEKTGDEGLHIGVPTNTEIRKKWTLHNIGLISSALHPRLWLQTKIMKTI